MPTATINTANQGPMVGEREREIKEERESASEIYVWRCGWPVWVASRVYRVCVCLCVRVSTVFDHSSCAFVYDFSRCIPRDVRL